MLRTISKYADFKNECCGQHINIGDIEHINDKTIKKIRQYANVIFTLLESYMIENKDSTKKSVVDILHIMQFQMILTLIIHG